MFPRESPYLPVLKLVLVLLGLVLLVSATSWGWYVAAAGVVLILAALLAACVIMIACVTRHHYRGWRADKREVVGVVARKWTRSYEYAAPAPMPGEGWLGTLLWLILRLLNYVDRADLVWTVYRQLVFWVVFEVNGKEPEFAVPEKLDVSFDEGTAGIVCYRGPKLVEFRPTHEWQRGTAVIERSQEVKHEENAGHT